MESLKSRKKGRKLEVNRSRQKSNKSKRERSPCVSSSESSDSSMSNHRISLRRRSRGRDSKRKRVRSRSRSTDSSDQRSRKRKRRSSTTRAGTEKKKKSTKKRHKEHPIRRRARGNKKRYRRSISISCSCSCSDSSCSYSSESCSTCSSSHSNSDESNRETRQSTRSKKGSNHWGDSKEIKQRHGIKGQDKKYNPYKKGADELRIRKSNGKKVHEYNGKVSSSSKVVRSPERLKTRKRIRNDLEERHSLSVPVENKKRVLEKYSKMDASQSGKSFSCNVEERIDESKAEALELLLRQKALENFRKFHGCQFGMAEVLSSNKFEQPVCLGSRESVQDVSYARLENTRAHENNEFGGELKELTVTDRVLNEHHIDNRRDSQQRSEPSSSQRENNTFVLDMDLVRFQPSGARETCTSPVLSSQIPLVSGFQADCDANTASLVSEVDPPKFDTSETILAHNDDNKPVKIAQKDSYVACLNKHGTWKTEVTEREESSVKVLQDCTFQKEIVSDNSTSDALQDCTLKNTNSQTKMVKSGRATAESSKSDTSQTEMHKSDDFPTSSKNQNSGTETIKNVESTGESPKEDASQSAIKQSVDSTFQQKTMSVMRGGEMVQVSYKVYIPQRAATLAKRQLKR